VSDVLATLRAEGVDTDGIHAVIGVREDRDKAIVAGSSKIFGAPDLPPGFAPPADLQFLVQINLAEVAPFDHERQLPASGMLYLYATDDEETVDSPDEAARVFFHPGPGSGGNGEGMGLTFGRSFVLDEPERFPHEVRQRLAELLVQSGHIVAETGTLLGPPGHAAPDELLVIRLDGGAVDALFSGKLICVTRKRDGAFAVRVAPLHAA
jgi:hypothetical protein